MGPRTIRIGVLGDFNPDFHSHHATNSALRHAAKAIARPVEITWVPTPSLLDPDILKTLADYDGLWGSPGSPYRSMDGMLAGIQFARARNRPYVAT